MSKIPAGGRCLSVLRCLEGPGRNRNKCVKARRRHSWGDSIDSSINRRSLTEGRTEGCQTGCHHGYQTRFLQSISLYFCFLSFFHWCQKGLHSNVFFFFFLIQRQWLTGRKTPIYLLFFFIIVFLVRLLPHPSPIQKTASAHYWLSWKANYRWMGLLLLLFLKYG